MGSYPYTQTKFQPVNVVPGARPAFVAASSFSIPAAATEIAYLIGGAARYAHVLRVQIGIVATAAAQGKVVLRRKSSAPSGGTSSDLTAVKFNTNDVAAVGVAKTYTALPVDVGTTVGIIKSYPYYIAAAADGAPQILDIDFMPYYPAKPGLELRSASEAISIGLEGSTYAGGLMHVS